MTHYHCVSFARCFRCVCTIISRTLGVLIVCIHLQDLARLRENLERVANGPITKVVSPMRSDDGDNMDTIEEIDAQLAQALPKMNKPSRDNPFSANQERNKRQSSIKQQIRQNNRKLIQQHRRENSGIPSISQGIGVNEFLADQLPVPNFVSTPSKVLFAYNEKSVLMCSPFCIIIVFLLNRSHSFLHIDLQLLHPYLLQIKSLHQDSSDANEEIPRSPTRVVCSVDEEDVDESTALDSVDNEEVLDTMNDLNMYLTSNDEDGGEERMWEEQYEREQAFKPRDKISR